MPIDYNAEWNNYQRTNKNPYNLREVSMNWDDNTPIYDAQGRHYKDQEYENGVSTDAPGYIAPHIQYEVNQGNIRPEDAAKASQVYARTGRLIYQTGGKWDPGSLDTYDLQDPAKRAEGQAASAAGHALPDNQASPRDKALAQVSQVYTSAAPVVPQISYTPVAPPPMPPPIAAPVAPPPVAAPAAIPDSLWAGIPGGWSVAPTQPTPAAPVAAAAPAPAPAPTAPAAADPEPTKAAPAAPAPPQPNLQLQALIDMATKNQEAQQAQRQQLNQILMQQLGVLGTPVTAEDSTLAPLLARQRLSSQREADRARALAAEQRGLQGLSDSGAMETDIRGIDEARAERNLGFEADTLFSEMSNRRNALQNLLGTAVSSNDTQAAQAAAQKLAALGQQMQGAQFDKSLAQNANQFGQDLGFKYAGLNQQGQQFGQNLGLQYANLNQQGQQFGQNLAFQYAGLNQQNNQFNASQQQRASEIAAQLGLNYAQLDQQQKQFVDNLALQQQQLAQQGSQFNDQQGYNWAALEQQGNLAALMQLLGAAA